MRNLRKLTAVVIAVALVLTSMTTAFAASTTYDFEAQAEVIKDLGIWTGNDDGDLMLGKVLTRAEGAVLVLKAVLGKTEADQEDADTANLSEFADAAKVPGWAEGWVALAVEEGVLKGTNKNELNAGGVLLGKDLASMFMNALGYADENDYGTAVQCLADKSASDFVDSLIEDLTNSKLTRDAAAAIVFDAFTATATDAEKNLIETIVGDNADLKAIAEEAGLIAKDANATSATVAATGAKILTVTFDGPVADPAKAVFAVKKGTITVNVSKVTFADDKKSAKLELATKLTAGDYTVSVSGVAASAFSATATATDEKVAKIEFTTGNAVLSASDDKIVTTTYKVFNQYNEDVTSANTLTFTGGKGTVSTPAAGTLMLTATSSFTVNEKVAVSAIHSATSTFSSTVLTVVPKAAVSDVAIESLYNSDSKTPVNGDTGSNYKLVVSAKDQYGNEVAAASVAADVIVTVSNTTVADVAGGANAPTFTTTSISGSNRTTLALAGTLASGTSTIAIISKSTGKVARFDVVVKESVKVDTLSLTVPEIAVAGEKVNIPFTAVDQFGTAITSAATLTAGMNSLTATGATGIAFKQDYVKNTAYLELDLSGVTAATTVFVTGVTKTNKVVPLQVSVVDPKKPVVINNTKDLTVNVAVGGTITLSENNLVAKDQYGRDITPDFGTATGKFRYDIATSDSAKVAVTGSAITADNGSVTLTGVAKGTSTLTVKIQKMGASAWEDVANSAITFDIKVVEKADIASYELADFAKLYQISAGTYDVDLTVNGLLADGSKVAVPTSFYTVTENDAYVSYAGGKLASITGRDFDDAATVDVPVIVTVIGANGPVFLTKNVTVVKAAPAITTIELASAGIVTKEADGVASVTYANAVNNLNNIVLDGVKAVDQYGKTITETVDDYAHIAASGFATGKSISNIAAGDTFNVIAITKGGLNITFKVIVK